MNLPIAWSEIYWSIPIMGLAVCLLAFVMGRSFIIRKNVKKPDPLQENEDIFLKGVTRDRRSMPRRSGNPVEVLISDGATANPARGWVLDRSQGGLGLLVDQPLPIGASLKVRASSAGESLPWIPITVRSCRRAIDHPGQFDVGCQFDHPPAWNLLLHFG